MSGRPPKNRVGDYNSDAQQLIHLSRAVMLDNTVSQHWRTTIREKLLELARDLMQPDYSLARKAGGIK